MMFRWLIATQSPFEDDAQDPREMATLVTHAITGRVWLDPVPFNADNPSENAYVRTAHC